MMADRHLSVDSRLLPHPSPSAPDRLTARGCGQARRTPRDERKTLTHRH